MKELVNNFMNWEVNSFDENNWVDIMSVVRHIAHTTKHDEAEMISLFGWNVIMHGDKKRICWAIERYIKSLYIDWSDTEYEVIEEKFNESNIVYRLNSEAGDRTILVICKEEEIIGLNFLQGLDEEVYDPCVHLTEIFRRLKHQQLSLEDRINKAIELYIEAFIIQEE